MIIIHAVIIQETYLFSSSAFFPHCVVVHSDYNLWITDPYRTLSSCFLFSYLVDHIFGRFGLRYNMPFSYVFHDEPCNTVQVAVILTFVTQLISK